MKQWGVSLDQGGGKRRAVVTSVPFPSYETRRRAARYGSPPTPLSDQNLDDRSDAEEACGAR
jgi:hypothetical protein